MFWDLTHNLGVNRVCQRMTVVAHTPRERVRALHMMHQDPERARVVRVTCINPCTGPALQPLQLPRTGTAPVKCNM